MSTNDLSIRSVYVQRLTRGGADSIYKTDSHITVSVSTWNVSGTVPDSRTNLSQLLGITSNNCPDIVLIGLQEVEEAAQVKRDTKEKLRQWQEAFQTTLKEHGTYIMACCRVIDLVGLAQLIFISSKLYGQASHIRSTVVEFEENSGLISKGAICTRWTVSCRKMCFVTAHLAAHEGNIHKRYDNVKQVFDSAAFELPMAADDEIDMCLQNKHYFPDIELGHTPGLFKLDSFDYIFWCGDLNYRVWLIDRNHVLDLIQKKDYTTLLKYDQLTQSMKAGQVFDGWQEMPIKFDPTFKYDKNSRNYDTSSKMRIPSWTDRILYFSKPCLDRGTINENQIEGIHYRRVEIMMSDHRPVNALFRVKVNQINQPELENRLKQVITDVGVVHSTQSESKSGFRMGVKCVHWPIDTKESKHMFGLKSAIVHNPRESHLFAQIKFYTDEGNEFQKTQQAIPGTEFFILPPNSATEYFVHVTLYSWKEHMIITQPRKVYIGEAKGKLLSTSFNGATVTIPSITGPKPFVCELSVQPAAKATVRRMRPLGVNPNQPSASLVEVINIGSSYVYTNSAKRSYKGIMSPVSAVSLQHKFRDRAAIPQDAAYYSYAYPPVPDRASTKQLEHSMSLSPVSPRSPTRGSFADADFLMAGGFFYFDKHKKLLQINSLVRDGAGLFFDGPHILVPNALSSLMEQDRIQPVTWWKMEDELNATAFAWITCDESNSWCSGLAPHGAFMFVLRESEIPAYKSAHVFYSVEGQNTERHAEVTLEAETDDEAALSFNNDNLPTPPSTPFRPPTSSRNETGKCPECLLS